MEENKDQRLSRRRHERFNIPPSVLNDSRFTAKNLSESGMMLFSATDVSVRRELSLELNLGGEILQISAVVRWCESSPSAFEPGYFIGVQFTVFSATTQLRLRRYIDDLAGGESAG